MEVKVVVRIIRIVFCKVRFVFDLIRGKNVGEVIVILKLINKVLLLVIEKVLMFVLVNVEYNYDMNIDELVVKEVYVNEGLILKCFCLCV